MLAPEPTTQERGAKVPAIIIGVTTDVRKRSNMNKREFLTMVASGEFNNSIMEYATEALAKMDESNRRKKIVAQAKQALKEAERAPIRRALFDAISETGKTAAQLIEETGKDLKPQAIPSLLKPLIESGEVVKTEVKIEGRKLRGYALPAPKNEA